MPQLFFKTILCQIVSFCFAKELQVIPWSLSLDYITFVLIVQSKEAVILCIPTQI